MPDWNLVNRAHVLAALDEYDRLGSREFLSRYRFGRSTAYTLWHGGQEYDSKAVLGVAFLHATGRAATRDEGAAGSLGGGAKVLERLGFDIAVDEEEVEREERSSRARVAKAPASARSSAGSTKSAASGTTARKAPARKAAEKKPVRIKPAEREVKICPTCYTALPATGVCDFCD